MSNTAYQQNCSNKYPPLTLNINSQIKIYWATDCIKNQGPSIASKKCISP